MEKEDRIMGILNGFLFKEEIENAYELAMNGLMKVSDVELETYDTNDICNVIGLYVN